MVESGPPSLHWPLFSKESEHSEGKFYVMFAGFPDELDGMLVKQRVYLLADDLDFVNDYTEEFNENKVRFERARTAVAPAHHGEPKKTPTGNRQNAADC